MSVEKFTVSKQDSPYSPIPNSVLQNLKNLDALGLWCYLQSKPPQWEFHKEILQKTFDIGEHKLEKLFKILKQHNLIEITHKRNEKGHFSSWHLHVKNGAEFDPSGKSWSTANPPSGKNGSAVNRAPVIRSYKRKKEEKKELIKEIVNLPDWIDIQDWNDFIAHRKHLKAPLSDNAQLRAINSLTKLKEKGENISDVINQSITNGWKGFFPIRNNYSKGTSNANKRKTNSSIHFDSCSESLKGTIYDEYKSAEDPFRKEVN